MKAMKHSDILLLVTFPEKLHSSQHIPLPNLRLGPQTIFKNYSAVLKISGKVIKACSSRLHTILFFHLSFKLVWFWH